MIHIRLNRIKKNLSNNNTKSVYKNEQWMRFLNLSVSQSAGAIEYTNCIYTEAYDPSPTNVLDMTVNNLMVRFQ